MIDYIQTDTGEMQAYIPLCVDLCIALTDKEALQFGTRREYADYLIARAMVEIYRYIGDQIIEAVHAWEEEINEF